MSDTINLTPDTLSRLKKAYKKAFDEGLDVFVFDGNKLVINYAKYLIEYGDMVHGRKRNG